MRRTLPFLPVLASGAAIACHGPQSALDPAGREAEWINALFVSMTVGAIVIWLGVVALALYAPRARPIESARAGHRFIIGAGVVFPAAVLAILIFTGMTELPRILAPSDDTRLTLEVRGVQWWWRVRYLRAGDSPVELANEIRLPVNRRLDVRLETEDVVHSFWMPSIAGKLDMIPGRLNRLSVQPTRTGTFRGACAEFCGLSHARMHFVIRVMEPQAFEQWLSAEAQPAAAPATPIAERGYAAFFRHGCSNCHTVRGTGAVGRSGPDLTHVGSRETIAAGQLPTSPEDFSRWISSTELLKPGAHMPAFAHLPDDTLAALAAYLNGLQ